MVTSDEKMVRTALEKVAHIESNTEAAKVVGVSASTMTRWRDGEIGTPLRKPTREPLRRFLGKPDAYADFRERDSVQVQGFRMHPDSGEPDSGETAYLQLAGRWEELSNEGRRFGLSDTAADILLECASELRRVVAMQSSPEGGELDDPAADPGKSAAGRHGGVTSGDADAPPGDNPNAEGMIGRRDSDTPGGKGAA